MRECDINRQFRDPTAMEALSHLPCRATSPARGTIVFPTQLPSEIAQIQAALNKLNGMYPGERKKKFIYRDPNYIRLREEILRGNLDVL